ncbi:hypothetical protein C8K18_10383 [Paraburkholderia sp. GV068]|nr:hypothetical protein [Paraburkholderia graminis]PTR02340.1 hypothetical protein C8K19_10383 [Paraburkholderia sp. GV072]PUB06817.1 hypothetical protein C8K18_10383 [Paraburkholderia sp. GV068]
MSWRAAPRNLRGAISPKSVFQVERYEYPQTPWQRNDR